MDQSRTQVLQRVIDTDVARMSKIPAERANHVELVRNMAAPARQLAEEIKAILIMDDDAVEKAVDIIAVTKKIVKGADEQRKKLQEDISGEVKQINSAYKGIIEALEGAVTVLTQKATAYNRAKAEAERKREEERRRREEEETLRQAEALAAAGKEDVADALLNVQQEVSEQERAEPVKTAPTRGAMGTMSSVKRWVWEVTNLAEVPLKYIQINEVAVNAAVRAGDRKIAGIRIYQDESARIR